MNMAPEEYKGTSFDQIEWIIYLLSGPENCKSIFFFPMNFSKQHQCVVIQIISLSTGLCGLASSKQYRIPVKVEFQINYRLSLS